MDISHLPRLVGYVLGGSGSLGAIQVGMLQALSEHNVATDIVAGTSVGSLNGAVIARDPTTAAHGAAARTGDSWLGRLDGGLAHEEFVLDGGQAAERGLSSTAVICAFDPGDDGDAQLVAGGPATPVEEIAVEFPAEAGEDTWALAVSYALPRTAVA